MPVRRLTAVLAVVAASVACTHDGPSVAKPDPAGSSPPAPCTRGKVSTTVPPEYLACATDADCGEWAPCCVPMAIARRYLHCTEPVTCPAVACVYTGGAKDACVDGACRATMPQSP